MPFKCHFSAKMVFSVLVCLLLLYIIHELLSSPIPPSDPFSSMLSPPFCAHYHLVRGKQGLSTTLRGLNWTHQLCKPIVVRTSKQDERIKPQSTGTARHCSVHQHSGSPTARCSQPNPDLSESSGWFLFNRIISSSGCHIHARDGACKTPISLTFSSQMSIRGLFHHFIPVTSVVVHSYLEKKKTE